MPSRRPHGSTTMLRGFLPEMRAGNYFAPVRRKELLSNPQRSLF